jgi:hypothetical protein
MEHFVLKENGKIFWIENFWTNYPASPIAQSAIDNAVEVTNWDEKNNFMLNGWKPLEVGAVYPLQCRVEKIERHNQHLPVALVTFDQPEEKKRKWIFFEEGHEDAPEFEIDADNSVEAFDKAFDEYGPQVNGFYYKLKDHPSVREENQASNKRRDEIIRILEQNEGMQALYPLLHTFETWLKQQTNG